MLKQKKIDLQYLTSNYQFDRCTYSVMLKTGKKKNCLIIAGQTAVPPFENPIPKNTELFRLVATDAYRQID